MCKAPFWKRATGQTVVGSGQASWRPEHFKDFDAIFPNGFRQVEVMTLPQIGDEFGDRFVADVYLCVVCSWGELAVTLRWVDEEHVSWFSNDGMTNSGAVLLIPPGVWFSFRSLKEHTGIVWFSSAPIGADDWTMGTPKDYDEYGSHASYIIFPDQPSTPAY
ncbi:MAG: hypothetical protein WAZ14_03030 [Patescibacteria group bacterium]